jgi:hypothetical protein
MTLECQYGTYGHTGMIAQRELLKSGGNIYFEGGPDDLFGPVYRRLRWVDEWIPVVAIRSNLDVHFFRLTRQESPGGAIYLVYRWSGARHLDDD